jgi:hypothetical protein
MNNESDDARRGAEALATLKNQEVGNVPDGLFDRIVGAATRSPSRQREARRFWLGTGFGAAIAASIFAVAVTLGWFGGPSASDPGAAQFQVVLNEPRQMDIAIETDQALTGATIRILMAGSIEIEGFSGQREISWVEDLDAGVNRLSLPIVATGDEGGQVVVRLTHPNSEQLFVVNLKTDSWFM